MCINISLSAAKPRPCMELSKLLLVVVVGF